MPSTRRNGIKTAKLQLTVDETTDRVVSEMVQIGIHGANKAEVASWILRNWIWENQKQLNENGISLKTSK
ncbi:MAG: hypothetical protein AB2603_17285 [Candidatus Thiodiazotropha endolucinida]